MSDIVNVTSVGDAVDNDDITVDNTTGGVTLLEANPNRKSALIINTGAEPMRVTTDDSAPTSTHGKLIVAGASLSLTSPDCPVKKVLAIRGSSSNTTANASEVV